MTYGQMIAWANVALSAGSCIGYGLAGDWKHALYFFFAAGITTTVIL